MNSDMSSSNYIARMKGKNIIATVITGGKSGNSYDSKLSLLEAKIDSVISAANGIITPPINLRYSNTQVTGQFLLTWTNEATDISNTIIETKTNGSWSVFAHASLGNATSYTITLVANTYIRVSTLTTNGVRSDPSNEVYIISAGSG
jgi:hypothetical protein